jgi:protein-S-isoprenylcysteine O-methyltransferase Ste14
MPQDFGERPNAVPWPPLIYSAALLIAWALERWDRFVWLDAKLAQVPHWVGLGIFAVGVALDLWALWVLRRNSTTVLPNARSAKLVQTGPYRFSRNPIYLGNTLAMIGLGLALRWGWLLFLVPVTVTAIVWLAISREERHLEVRFGSAWKDYASKVRRWL